MRKDPEEVTDAELESDVRKPEGIIDVARRWMKKKAERFQSERK